MDFKGQKYNERLFQTLVILFGIIGFVVGYINQQFRLTFLWLSAGGGISAVLCLPDWPWWNCSPLEWLPAPDEEEEEELRKEKKAQKKKDKAAKGEKEGKKVK
uniref:Signal peptidase complex subunit 1 n=1 Tax=Phaeocystis antarctica TaxID=33657 RepID=A0A7S0HRJ4_9EUKA|mmetsp:Transcript_32046/g.75660  ORF Transcript_32046/g.75660 Transcript_32046/m.75660 type:complete len:103 (+) Transcript_32046:56-364(+)